MECLLLDIKICYCLKAVSRLLRTPGGVWSGGGLVWATCGMSRDGIARVAHTFAPPGMAGRNPRPVHTQSGYQALVFTHGY